MNDNIAVLRDGVGRCSQFTLLMIGNHILGTLNHMHLNDELDLVPLTITHVLSISSF